MFLQVAGMGVSLCVRLGVSLVRLGVSRVWLGGEEGEGKRRTGSISAGAQGRVKGAAREGGWRAGIRDSGG